MKLRSVYGLLAVASLAACAQTPRVADTPTPSAGTSTAAVAPPPAHPYALPVPPARPMVSAPSWFVQLPQDTADMTFAVGTATSTDEQMAYDKARLAAERKLVEQMYSRITTQTNSYRADRGQAMIENFQQVTRKNARGELSGAQRVDSQATYDGRMYKVYVLLRLPMGEANVMQTRRDQQRLQQEADIRSRAAERNMDANEAADAQRAQDARQNLERDLAPQSQVAPVVVPGENSTKSADTAPTTSGDVKLLDVDNEEYKRRRAETLSKPGAVIGQVTVQ